MSPTGALPCDDSLNMQSFTLLFPVNNILMHREWKKLLFFVVKPQNWELLSQYKQLHVYLSAELEKVSLFLVLIVQSVPKVISIHSTSQQWGSAFLFEELIISMHDNFF